MRVAKWILIGLAALAGLAAVAGAIYQSAGLDNDESRYPPPGEMVDIGTHRLHLHCLGGGAPVVLLDAGAGGWSLHWFGVHAALGAHTKTCAFDRSGLGWSEPSLARDGHSLATELHKLLQRAAVEGPVVYVGHSLGANLAQTHFARYPEDIAALVMLDPGRPVDMLENFAGGRDEALGNTTCGWHCTAARWLTRLGVVRLVTRGVGLKTLGAERQALYHAGLSKPHAAETVVGYLQALPATAYQLRDIDTFGDTPVRVIYSGETREPEGAESPADVTRWHAEVLADMARLVAKSSRGVGPRVLDGATHQSMVVDPQYTAQVVTEVLATLVEVQKLRPI